MVQSYLPDGTNVPSHEGTLEQPGNTMCLCFLRPIQVHNANGKWIGSSIFAQFTAECRYTLQRAVPFPFLKLPFPRGSGPHLTRFLRPIQAHNPNGIWIGSAVLQGSLV